MSKQARLKQQAEAPLMSQILQRIREGVFIVTLGSALFVLLALTTYHAGDPGWSHTGMMTPVANAAGKAGAWLSDLLFYLFGYMSYLFPFMVIYAAWFFIHRPLVHANDYVFFILRCAGFILLVAAGSGLATLESVDKITSLPFTAGGVLGHIVGFGLVKSFNLLGTLLLLLSLALLGLTLLIEFSWLSVVERIGYATLITCKSIGWVNQLVGRSRSSKEGDEEVIEEDEEAEDEEDDDEPRLQRSAKSKNSAARTRSALTIDEEEDEDEEEEEIRREPTLSLRSLMGGSVRALKEKAGRVVKEKERPSRNEFRSSMIEEGIPSLQLLDLPAKTSKAGYSAAALEQMSHEVEQRLLDFGVEAQVVAVHPGPVITRFELQLAAGIKVSKISGLSKDLARSLSVTSVRVVEIIPGKSVIGLEVPNAHRESVRLREVLASSQYDQAKSPLSLALGKDIAGHPVVVDLAKMPHLLVAGTTGAGKSVGLNVMLLSILFKSLPEEVRMILIDPKMLELSIYEGVPHLLTPVVTDMKEAANALRWCVAEMERRYKLMASLGVRNLGGFNMKVKEAIQAEEPIPDPLWNSNESLDEEAPGLEPLPYIVVVIDEFADMMMVVGKKVEELIARIAQKARAAGIHLILATQRPSVDVITGLIKANIPTRIAFQVSSRIDSRTILDQQGAEQLLGQGDMLYLPPGTGVPVRVHGAFVDDNEVHRVVQDWKKRGEPNYLTDILESYDNNSEGGGQGGNGDTDGGEGDELYDEAVRIVTETRRASISNIQRRLRIGFNRAARLLEEMEQSGIVSPMESNGLREVLAPPPPAD